MRNNRAEKARETLKILDRGRYTVNDCEFDIAQEVHDNIKNTTLYSPEKLDALLNVVQPETELNTIIEVYNETTIQGALALFDYTEKIGVLNFASKEPRRWIYGRRTSTRGKSGAIVKSVFEH